MDIDTLLSSMHDALSACAHPRFFETERGFQGQLLVELDKPVHLPPQAIIEQEYQKRLYIHGLTIRPDIVIHEPYHEGRHVSRATGNIAVIELKLKASADQAAADFESLAAMLKVLRYPFGIFVNIGAPETPGALVPEGARGRIASFAVFLAKGKPTVLEART
jgi:hypothetical protein